MNDDYGNYIAWCREVGLTLNDDADTLALDSAQTATRAAWAAKWADEPDEMAKELRGLPIGDVDDFEALNPGDADHAL